MNGVISNYFVTKVTHLIVGDLGSKKVKVNEIALKNF